MSFLYDAVLPGSGKLFTEGALGGNQRHLRKSRSHAGLLTPLAQFLRDPASAIGGKVDATTSARTKVASGTEVERKQVLYLRLKDAESYEEWKAAATALDHLEGNDVWKSEDESDEYNAALVAARLEQLDDARLSCDVKKMLFLVRTSLTRSLGGMGQLQLYKHSHIGTKALIERYIASAQKTLTALLEVSAKQGSSCPINSNTLVEQLLLARQSFGRSALLLSGGGTFGMNHIGVVKCLWQSRLLPRIISGASAGSIVCAVLCTKTDAEIPQVLEDFCHGDLAVFEREGEEEGLIKKVTRFMKYGALFDISLLMNVMRSLLGDITFQESYNRTRRILNITVSSASLYELPRLLNYVTAPNVMIWSAVCASCSVPFVFSAASILAKDPRTGQEIPWNQTPNASWIDGSVDNDLPMTRLAEMFNVNHFIVSQVNPHVVPFLAREEEVLAAEATSAASPGWVHELAGLAKGEALHRLQVLSEMGIFPNYLSKARSILNQRYSGDITIFPSISYSHFPKVLSNPTPEYMAQCLLRGERATWPKLSRIQNHLAIELALDETIRQIRARTVFTPNHGFNPENTTRPLSGTGRARDASKRRAISRSHDTAIPSSGITFHSPGRTRHPLVHLPSSHGARRHLLMSRTKKRATSPLGDTQLSSSASGASSEDDMSLDSDAYHKPPNSEYYQAGPPHRRLFPHASQPSTPSFHDSYIAHQSNSSLNLDKASEAASERPIQSHIRQEARRPTQFPTMTPSTLQETECMSDTTATTSEQDAEPAIQNSRPNRC